MSKRLVVDIERCRQGQKRYLFGGPLGALSNQGTSFMLFCRALKIIFFNFPEEVVKTRPQYKYNIRE